MIKKMQVCPCGGGQSCIVDRRLNNDWVDEDCVLDHFGLARRKNCWEQFTLEQYTAMLKMNLGIDALIICNTNENMDKFLDMLHFKPSFEKLRIDEIKPYTTADIFTILQKFKLKGVFDYIDSKTVILYTNHFIQNIMVPDYPKNELIK
jgi:hypothetical protein